METIVIAQSSTDVIMQEASVDSQQDLYTEMKSL